MSISLLGRFLFGFARHLGCRFLGRLLFGLARHLGCRFLGRFLFGHARRFGRRFLGRFLFGLARRLGCRFLSRLIFGLGGRIRCLFRRSHLRPTFGNAGDAVCRPAGPLGRLMFFAPQPDGFGCLPFELGLQFLFGSLPMAFPLLRRSPALRSLLSRSRQLRAPPGIRFGFHFRLQLSFALGLLSRFLHQHLGERGRPG